MSTTSQEFQRTIPVLTWPPILLIAGVLVVLAVVGWEWHCRAAGYVAGLDDTRDLWVEQRRQVASDDTVIIGSSRTLFGLDLDVLGEGLGRRPKQLSLVGSCVYPVLQDFADDQAFHGTVICDVVPGLLMVPPMAPPYHNAEKAIARNHTQSYAQRWSFWLSLPLERTFACLQQEDLTLPALLNGLALPNRAHAQVGPALPPHFSTIDRDRRTWMREQVITDQSLRDRVKFGWLPLFTPPPKPHWIPDEAFGAYMKGMSDGRFAAMAKAVAAIRARGGRVVFVQMPSQGDLKAVEEKWAPKVAVWDRLLKETGAPGITADEHPELNAFELPEWSHLSAKDSVEFTRRLVPLLQTLLRPAG